MSAHSRSESIALEQAAAPPAACERRVALIECDLDGVVRRATGAALVLLGCTAGELLGHPHRARCSDDSLAEPGYDAFWLGLRAPDATAAPAPLRCLLRGAAAPVAFDHEVVLDAAGRPVAVVAVAADAGGGLAGARAAHGHAAVEAALASIVLDLDGRLVAIDEALAARLGYAAADLVGQPYRMLCASGPAHAEATKTLWEGVRGGRAWSGDTRLLCKDGEPAFFTLTALPSLGDGGAPSGVLVHLADVTEARTRALEAQAVAAAVQRTQAVVEFDLEGRVLHANELFLAAFGYTLGEVVGKSHRMFCVPAHADSAEYAAFWAELRGGRPRCGEFMRMHRQGRAVWLQAHYTPILGAHGHPVKVVKFASDITAIKNKSLEDEGKVAAIGRSQGVIEFDLSGHVLTANEKFLALTGYTLEEIRGRHHRLFVEAAEGAGSAYRAFWQKLADGQYDAGEYLRIAKGGRRVWMQASYNPILDAEGRPTRVVKFCADITAGKLQALETAARMAAVSAAHAIVELDRDGRIASANELFQRTMGYGAADLVGKPESALMFDEDVSESRQLDAWRRLRLGESCTMEQRRKAAGGREVWLAASLSPVLDFDGTLAKVITVASDVTADKMQRLDAQGRLSAIDRAQAVVEFDLEGRVIAANENFLALTGYGLDEVRGRHHRMFVEPGHAASPE